MLRGTIVTFHAHPDDEAIATGGTMARAAEAGHRVVLVVATRGELGEVGDGVLAPGETLAERRVAETHRSAAVLGVSRVVFLDYRDSGMVGESSNDAPGSFASADVGEAAEQLAAILRDEQAEVLTVYDERGVYGHPDHLQVHRVGVLAGAIARTHRVYEATLNRDHVLELMREHAHELTDLSDLPNFDEFDIGLPAHRITTTVDVRPFLETKREAMRAHPSQISDTSFFLQMPEEPFRETFGWEWYIRRDTPPGVSEDWLFPT